MPPYHPNGSPGRNGSPGQAVGAPLGVSPGGATGGGCPPCRKGSLYPGRDSGIGHMVPSRFEHSIAVDIPDTGGQKVHHLILSKIRAFCKSDSGRKSKINQEPETRCRLLMFHPNRLFGKRPVAMRG